MWGDKKWTYSYSFGELNMDGRIRSEKKWCVNVDWIELAEKMVLW